MILNGNNIPFSDMSVANQVAAVLSRETGCFYAVTQHHSGGYVLVKKETTKASPLPPAEHQVESEVVPRFDEIRFRPAWRSQLGGVVSTLFGVMIFIFSDAVLNLFQIDQLLILLQDRGVFDRALVVYVLMSTIISFVGLAYAGWALLKACYFIYSHHYFIGPQGIEENEGVISKNQSRIEFKHIRGVNLRQSIFQRLLGVGTIDIATSGSEESEVRFVGIANPKRYLSILRKRLKALV